MEHCTVLIDCVLSKLFHEVYYIRLEEFLQILYDISRILQEYKHSKIKRFLLTPELDQAKSTSKSARYVYSSAQSSINKLRSKFTCTSERTVHQVPFKFKIQRLTSSQRDSLK